MSHVRTRETSGRLTREQDQIRYLIYQWNIKIRNRDVNLSTFIHFTCLYN